MSEAIDKFSEGISLLRSEYYTDIRDMAEELINACKSGEIADRESLFDRIHEECDGSQWVIYTQRAQVVLLVSDNDGHGVDEGLVGPESFKDGVPWSQLAYCAMEQDLMEQMDSDDFDINDDSEWQSEKEIREAVAKLDRAACVKLLEAISIQCNDDESDDVLREAVLSNTLDGTIDRQDVIDPE